ncbi:hypothetical protein Tco_0634786 [Tanacetum coccineum]
MSIGAEMNHKEPGFELEDSKMGRNGLLAFVRLDFELRGFKAFRRDGEGVSENEGMVPPFYTRSTLGGQGNLGIKGATAKLWQEGSDVLDL